MNDSVYVMGGKIVEGRKNPSFPCHEYTERSHFYFTLFIE